MTSFQAASADSFGRFGYRPLADLPGFKVDQNGVQTRASGADLLQFPHRSRTFRPSVTNATSQTVDLDCGPGGPSAVRFSLIGDSLDLYYGQGLELDLTCSVAPYLSWKDGSVGPNVPTPTSPWLLLSFATDQPPIVLGFSGLDSSLEVTGAPGKFKITCPVFTGWLRMMLPVGLRPVRATDAASLGKLIAPIALESQRWSAPTPKVLKQSVAADGLGVDAEWTFSGPGAIVPPAVLLAQLGGYPVSIRTGHHTLPIDTELGPLEEVDGDTLAIHFPSRLINPGRALGISPPVPPSPQPTHQPTNPPTHQPTDLPTIVDLALSCLVANRDPSSMKAADDASTAYLSNATYFVEPFTGQQLPFDADGSGLDLAAAYALLGQATSTAIGSQEPDALFTSVMCRRDWWTWALWDSDPVVARRATALAAVAGALAQDPTMRLLGAMLEAGVDAQKGLAVIQRRAGQIAEEPEFSEPLLDLRASMFALERRTKTDTSFFDLLQSPLRIGAGEGLTLTEDPGGLQLKWLCSQLKPSLITFLGSTDLKFSAASNIIRLNSVRSPTALSMFYVPDSFGPCQLRVSFPADHPRVPLQVAPLKYSEAAVR